MSVCEPEPSVPVDVSPTVGVTELPASLYAKSPWSDVSICIIYNVDVIVGAVDGNLLVFAT